jgi:predicted DNA-binding transcriptional regulator YafY
MSHKNYSSLRTMYIRNYLLKYTDEDHPTDLKSIQNMLHSHEIEATIKTIRTDINMLDGIDDECGLEIQEFLKEGEDYKPGTPKQYYTTDRLFDHSELRILIGAIAASKVINAKHAKDFIAKIRTLSSEYEKDKLNVPVFFDPQSSIMATNLLINANEIYVAIEKDCPISFYYLAFNSEKKLVKRYEEKYIVHPYYLVWADDAYYLICYDPKRGDRLVHLRVDRMKDVTPLEAVERKQLKEIIGEETLDLRKYLHKHINMYTGESQRVKMQFTNDLISVVIDQFGDDVTIRCGADENTFFAFFDVVISQMFFSWCFRFGPRAKIIGPENVKNQYKIVLQSQVDSF